MFQDALEFVRNHLKATPSHVDTAVTRPLLLILMSVAILPLLALQLSFADSLLMYLDSASFT